MKTTLAAEQRAAVKSHARPGRGIPAICLTLYLLAVLWYTVGRRSVGYYPSETAFFWSYRLWFEGNRKLGLAIIANIAMFVPFGFLVSALIRGKESLSWVLLAALAFSSLIETAQFVLMRGSLEFDDIFNNVCGALLGALCFLPLRRLLPENRLRALLSFICAGIALSCLAVFLFSTGGDHVSMTPLPRGLCFQVEEAEGGACGLRMSGVCFWYGHGPKDCQIVLQSTQSGETIALHTVCGLPRPDVNEYFRRGRDDTNSGFEAVCGGVQEDEEYEITLDFGLLRRVPTGVYLTASREVSVHYVPNAVFKPLETEGTDLAAIAAGGVLRACNPENHVYVYWYQGRLYWIADEGFYFEDDGATRIELKVWPANAGSLLEKARAAGGQHDSLRLYFEKSELKGNFGRYRVLAAELPTDYSIASITTGYYFKRWIWQENFWPVYDFGAEREAGLPN